MQLRSNPSGGARWRPADTSAGEGELLFAGPRVALGGGHVVLPWRETLRYAPRKAGYHGGASPAEAVIPLTILSASGRRGRTRLGRRPGGLPGMVARAGRYVLGGGRRLPCRTPSSTSSPPRRPHRGPARRRRWSPPCWPATTYRKRHKLAGRAALPDDRVAALLSALVAAGGRARIDSVAAEAGIPAHRISLTITALRRLLQVEGYPVLDHRPGRADRDTRRAAATRTVPARVVTVPVEISQRRRREVIDALRRGTVPRNGLDVLAVGLDRFVPAVDAELATVVDGGVGVQSRPRRVRRRQDLLHPVAGRAGQAPRHGHRRGADLRDRDAAAPAGDRCTGGSPRTSATEEFPPSALRPVLDDWMFTLEEDVLAAGTVAETTPPAWTARSASCWSAGWAASPAPRPTFAAALRGYRTATAAGDTPTAEGLAAWLGGQPNVAASVRRQAGVKGELDHFGAFGFLQGLLTVLRDCGHPGLLVVLDEVETLQRMRSDVAGQGAQRAAAAHRRDRQRPVPRPVPADHRYAGVLRRHPGRAAPSPAGAAAGHRLHHRRALRQPAGGADPATRIHRGRAARARRPGTRPVRRRAARRRPDRRPGRRRVPGIAGATR